MPYLPFISQNYVHRSNSVASQATINFYMEKVEVPSRSQYCLIGTAGVGVFSDLTSLTEENDSCRGIYTSTFGLVYSVFGAKLLKTYKDTLGAVITDLIGTLSTASGVISMVDNGKYLTIADGSSIVNVELSTNVMTFTTIPFDTPTRLIYKGLRIFCINESVLTNQFGKLNNQIFYSDAGLDGCLTWDALSVVSAEQSQDPIVTMGTSAGNIWFLGSRTLEVWAGSDNPNKPITFVAGGTAEIGCGAKNSVAQIGDSLFWLGSSSAGVNQIFTNQGYSAVRISDHSIEYRLGKVADITTDAVGFAYQQEGHIFYVLTFIQADFTICYDLTEGMWHERATRDPLLNINHRYEPIFATFGLNRVICGSIGVRKLLYLDLDKYDDYDGRPIVRSHRSQVYFDNMNLVEFNSFQIDMLTGQGLQSGQGFDPQVMVRWSNNAGSTWSNEHWKSAGKIGEYSQRVVFRSLGMGRLRIFEMVVSDPVKWVVQDAQIEVISGGK